MDYQKINELDILERRVLKFYQKHISDEAQKIFSELSYLLKIVCNADNMLVIEHVEDQVYQIVGKFNNLIKKWQLSYIYMP